MGMFDELKCSYPLPSKGTNGLVFQTKDTDSQSLDLYEIRSDGTFWLEKYDIEDKSDPEESGLKRLIGMMTRVNKRWVSVEYNGSINFYSDRGPLGWIEFQACFDHGLLVGLSQISKENKKS